jgi:drug/metabolite transporter (DMT)-like permease
VNARPNVEASPAVVDRPLLGISLMLLSVVLFGLLDTAAKWLTGRYPVFEVVWARYVCGLILLLAAAPMLPGRFTWRTRRPALQALRGALLFVTTAMFVTAISYIPLATATAIGFVAPFFVTALSIPVLGERVGWRRWTAIAFGFVGMLIVIRPGLADTHWAMILPATMAMTYAIYLVITRLIRDLDEPLTSLFYPTCIGSILGSAIVPFVWVVPTLPDVGVMFLAGLFGTAGHLILIRAFGLAPASVLAPFTYVQLVWATILGILVFGDWPDAATLIGAAIIIASGIYVAHREAITAQARGRGR